MQSTLRARRVSQTTTGLPTSNPQKDEQMKDEVQELFAEQLKDAHSAEKQALRCMQKTVRKASIPTLRDGIQMHIEQTQVQIERIEQIMESLKVRPGRKVCEAMRGLVEEAQHEIEEYEKGPILDLVIVAGMQRIEHYEIAAYGTDIALARALGEQEAVDLLSETLEEEKQTDLRLTEITERQIMAEALGGEPEANAGGGKGGTSKGRTKAA
jgi:ferritin-like metal-binding protein YciE